MMKAYISRSPWVAGLLTLIFGPLFGLCYVNKGRLALGFFISNLLIMLPLTAVTSPIAGGLVGGLLLSAAILRVIVVIITIVIARKTVTSALKWYTKAKYLWGFVFLGPLILFLLFRSFIAEAFTISASSMSPTLQKGDYIFVNKFLIGIEHGDIVAFRTEQNRIHIKRVIGVGADKIDMVKGKLSINGAPLSLVRGENIANHGIDGALDEGELFYETLPNGTSYVIINLVDNSLSDLTQTYEVPPNSYFMMGDNRDNSNDSRYSGSIYQDDLVGELIFGIRANENGWLQLIYKNGDP